MNKIRCVLIDDDEDDHEFFIMAIKETNHLVEYTAYKDGREAVSFLKDLSGIIPDYIFIDLNMPYIDGRTCLSQVRQLEHLRKSKVIVFTSSIFIDVIEEVKFLGADHFFSKPSDFNSLVTSIKAIFSGSKLPFLIKN